MRSISYSASCFPTLLTKAEAGFTTKHDPEMQEFFNPVMALITGLKGEPDTGELRLFGFKIEPVVLNNFLAIAVIAYLIYPFLII